MLTFPAIFNVIALVVLDFGAFPRSFLYVLPLGLLLLVRGALVATAWLTDHLLPEGSWKEWARWAGGPLTVGAMILVSAVSVLLNYRYPKQDHTSVLAYVTAHKSPHDVVCVVGWAASSHGVYYAQARTFPASLEELKALEAEGRAVWVLYPFTRDMRRFLPEMFDYIQDRFELTARLPGTLGDGDLYVARFALPREVTANHPSE